MSCCADGPDWGVDEPWRRHGSRRQHGPERGGAEDRECNDGNDRCKGNQGETHGSRRNIPVRLKSPGLEIAHPDRYGPHAMIHFLTVSTQNTPGAQRYLASARRVGIEPRLIGAGVRYSGHAVKCELFRDEARKLPPNDIVVATDCWDVVFLRGAAAFEAEFKALGTPFLASTEPGLKYQASGRFATWRRYPEPPRPGLPWRYINGGGFMGYAGAMADILSRVDLKATYHCDQTALNRWFVDHPDTMALDYEQRVFASTIWREGLETQDFEASGEGLRHRLTQSTPCIMHFGGENSISSQRVLDMLPYALPSIGKTRHALPVFAERALTNRLTKAFGLRPYPFVDVLSLSLKLLLVTGVAASLAGLAHRFL